MWTLDINMCHSRIQVCHVNICFSGIWWLSCSCAWLIVVYSSVYSHVSRQLVLLTSLKPDDVSKHFQVLICFIFRGFSWSAHKKQKHNNNNKPPEIRASHSKSKNNQKLLVRLYRDGGRCVVICQLREIRMRLSRCWEGRLESCVHCLECLQERLACISHMDTGEAEAVWDQ